MRGIASRPMCRPKFAGRSITADRRVRRRKLPLHQRHTRSLVLAGLVAFLLQVECRDVSSTGGVTRELVNINSIEKTSSFLTNEIILDNNDDDDFYLGYSGYLRSSSSLLALGTQHNNFTGNNLSSNSSDTLEPSEAKMGHQRFKRAVTHLYNMIVCATGCNPLAYKGYGCYCGFLGSGFPMDGIDRCCKMHDWCYDATDCPMFVEYFVPYYWKCYRGYKPICAIEHGEWGSSGSCAQRLCECDRSFSECLRRYRCPRHKAVCTSSPWRLIQNIFMII